MAKRFKAPVSAVPDVPADARLAEPGPTFAQPEVPARASKVLVEDEEEVEELFRSESPLQLRRGPHPVLALGIAMMVISFATMLVAYTFTDTVEPTTARPAVTIRTPQPLPTADNNATESHEALVTDEEYNATD
ncbi:hypothetical protein HPB50_014984 [Hyalomma asiaticum]|uniref:Uncharacterized protein n=1 Tax=Hyalomma asiaticum TaxID=266040 RepID=A0ACB7S949_HYAAI|nr:hypothetical protein HPB50_014984 [Hyalomma asiaticum]